MKMLSIKPTIYKFKTAEEFAAEFKIGVGDLVITNEYIYQPFFGSFHPYMGYTQIRISFQPFHNQGLQIFVRE